jgi:integrase
VCWREHGRDRSRTFTFRKDAERFRTDVERRPQLGPLYEARPITLAAARASWKKRWQIGKAASTVQPEGRGVAACTAARRGATEEDFVRLEFHDLRHTIASLMIAARANPLQLAEALGHTDQHGRPDPTLVWKRYGHLYPGSTREAAAASIDT